MMRVLHLTRDFLPRCAGGISTAVSGMVHALGRAGLACAVISFDGWRPRAKSGTRLAHASAGPLATSENGIEVLRVSTPADLAEAHAFSAAFGPTHVHVHDSMLWELAAELRQGLGVPALIQVHVLQSEQNRLRGLTEATASLLSQERALAQADRVIAPSRTVAELLGRAHPELCPRLCTVGLGVDDGPGARQAAFEQSMQARGPVVYAGRFADINGTAELFAAIPEILDRVPGTEFVIAGGVPENRKAEARWHRRWSGCVPEHVRSQVRFAGWLAPEALAWLYGQARVLISPSWFETFGMVVVEAMLHGCAISATAAGAVTELIEHGRTGLLSEPRDVRGLVDHTVRLLQDPALAAALGRAAAESVRQARLWPAMIPGLVRAYEAAMP